MILFNPITITVLLIFIIVVISVLGGFIWLRSKGIIKNSLETEMKVSLSLNETFEKILEALQALKADVREKDLSSGYIKAYTGLPPLTWRFLLLNIKGVREIKINFTELEASKSKIRINLEPYLFYKYIMWPEYGVNKRDLKKITSYLKPYIIDSNL